MQKGKKSLTINGLARGKPSEVCVCTTNMHVDNFLGFAVV